jgi:hypothetical protein
MAPGAWAQGKERRCPIQLDYQKDIRRASDMNDISLHKKVYVNYFESSSRRFAMEEHLCCHTVCM